MNTAEVRDALERTGALFTQDENDPGHISDYWRGVVQDLCAALDAAPQNAGELLRAERAAHSDTLLKVASALDECDAALAKADAERRSRSAAEDARQVAVQLVAEAMPRMESLNNAMSPGWLARASALLEG